MTDIWVQNGTKARLRKVITTLVRNKHTFKIQYPGTIVLVVVDVP